MHWSFLKQEADINKVTAYRYHTPNQMSLPLKVLYISLIIIFDSSSHYGDHISIATFAVQYC